ncbi:MAG: tetratricopeptide repeat protein [Gemmatimonadales bacterium]
MNNPRIQNLRRMLEKHPDDPRLRFGLALEYEKLERWEDVAEQLRTYLELNEDEGNAWGRLGAALRRLGRDAKARDAYRNGMDAAHRHGHPTMAAEFEEILADWDS